MPKWVLPVHTVFTEPPPTRPTGRQEAGDGARQVLGVGALNLQGPGRPGAGTGAGGGGQAVWRSRGVQRPEEARGGVMCGLWVVVGADDERERGGGMQLRRALRAGRGGVELGGGGGWQGWRWRATLQCAHRSATVCTVVPHLPALAHEDAVLLVPLVLVRQPGVGENPGGGGRRGTVWGRFGVVVVAVVAVLVVVVAVVVVGGEWKVALFCGGA